MTEPVWLAVISACVSVVLAGIAAVTSIIIKREVREIANGMKGEAWHAGRDSMRKEIEHERK